MELSPYLKAIQEVSGSTPGEKYRAINRIAFKLLSSRNIKRSLKNLDFPEVLKLLVEVEIARKLRQPDMILEALKSKNWEVVMRAVKASWFFNGGNKMTSVGFYQTQIFLLVSVKNRRMIIKALA
ncbi:GSCOCG00004992001-RA-CDS, partial [Cotesia congregata]